MTRASRSNCVLLCTALLLASTHALAVDIVIDTPSGTDVVTEAGGMAFLSGRLEAFGPAQVGLDLVIAIDVSDSTDEPLPGTPAALRLDARPTFLQRLLARVRGPARPDPADTLFAAQLRLARTLVGTLDPRATRVGVVAFGGDRDPEQPDAWTVTGLSSDLDAAHRGLNRLETRGPRGFTNLDAGVNRALSELLDTPSATSASRGKARRAVLVFTDGVGPTGFARREEAFAARARERAARAARAGVQIDLVIVGEEAERTRPGASAWVEATAGRLVGVYDPSRAPILAHTLHYSGAHSLVVRNLTSGAEIRAVELTPDGGFGCLVPLVPGTNKVELRAELPGRAFAHVVELRPVDTEAGDALSLRQLALRNRLLEDHLRSLGAERVQRERNARARSVEIEVPAAADDQNPD